MLDTQPDSLRDRADYWAPGCDVSSADVVGVRSKAASGTGELRLRATVRLVDVAALRARPARVARVHGHESHARERGLVCDERAQLEERPRVQRHALSLTNRNPVSDALEILKGDASSGVFGFAYDRLANHMICVGVEAFLSSTKLSEVAPGALGAGRLQGRTKLGDARTVGEDGFAGMRLPVRIEGKVTNSEVDAEPAIGLNGRAVRHVNGYEQEKLTLAINQVGLTADTLESSAVVGANGARHNEPPVERQEAHAVEPVLEAVEALVVRDSAMGPEGAAPALVATIDLADLADGPHGMLCRQAEEVSHLPVVEPLQSELVCRPKLEGPLGEPVACFVHANHRGKQPSFFLEAHQQSNRRDELHKLRRSTPKHTSNRRQRFLPRLQGGGGASSLAIK